MNLMNLTADYSNLNISISWILIILTLVLFFILKIGLLDLIKNKFFKKFKITHYEINEVKLGIGESSISFIPNNDDRKIAFKLWVELSTRKLGLPIDLDEDVIVDLYDSWYAFFGVARDLLKDFPISKLNDENNKDLIEITMELLNEVLRVHLTKWQAKYRKWYSEELKSNNLGLSPQEIQRNYEHYNELTEDLLKINKNLQYYQNVLNSIAYDKELCE